MSVLLQADPLPLREEADGSIRVGNSRVLLDLVIHAFQEGATPEAIVQRYDTLRLDDVYAVISFYLRHTAEIEAYLERRELEAAEVRRKIEAAQPDMKNLRQRLLQRQEAQRSKNGPVDHG
jgi:uncharacterized protein (DUF433 family)